MTTIDSNTRATGPVTCQPWCDNGAGHPAETWAEDQYCRAYLPDLTLSLPIINEPNDEIAVTAYAGGGWPAHVEVLQDSMRGFWRMTPDEAEALASSLVQAARMARTAL